MKKIFKKEKKKKRILKQKSVNIGIQLLFLTQSVDNIIYKYLKRSNFIFLIQIGGLPWPK